MIQRILRRGLLVLILAAIVAGMFRSRHGPRFRLPRVAPWATSRTLPVRPDGTRVPVDPARVWVDDGDTIRITWPDGPARQSGFWGSMRPRSGTRTTPRVRTSLWVPNRSLSPAAGSSGPGDWSSCALHLDRFGRTLGYLFVDGVNYSVLAIENHMAESTIGRFGDSGFPREAAEVVRAARWAGPPPFEIPGPVPGPDRALPRKPHRSRRTPLPLRRPRSLLRLHPATRPESGLIARCNWPRARVARCVPDPCPPGHRPAA